MTSCQPERSRSPHADCCRWCRSTLLAPSQKRCFECGKLLADSNDELVAWQKQCPLCNAEGPDIQTTLNHRGNTVRFFGRDLRPKLALDLAKALLRRRQVQSEVLAASTVNDAIDNAMQQLQYADCRQSRKVYERADEDGYFMEVLERYQAHVHIYIDAGPLLSGPRRILSLVVEQREEGCEDYHESGITVTLKMNSELQEQEGDQDVNMISFGWLRGDSAIKTLKTKKEDWRNLAELLFGDRRELRGTGDFLARILGAPAETWRAEGGGHGSPWFEEVHTSRAPNPNLLLHEIEAVIEEAVADVRRQPDEPEEEE